MGLRCGGRRGSWRPSCWPGQVRSKSPEPAGRLSRFEFEETHMASPFKIVLYSTDDATARRASRAAFDRIAALNAILSDYDPESELSRLSQIGGRPAGSGQRRPVRRARAIQADVRAIGRGVRRHDRARWAGSGGGPAATASCRTPSGSPRPGSWSAPTRWCSIPTARTVQLVKPGMKLDVGGIAKGYAAQAALDVLKAAGISRALVARGRRHRRRRPAPGRRRLDDRHRARRARPRPARPPCLLLENAAVSTAGDAERFVIIDGHRYSHIINPATGLGVEDRASVTVVAPDGATADALETTVYLLGPERGLKLVDETPGAAAIFVRSTPKGSRLRIVAVQASSASSPPGVTPKPGRLMDRLARKLSGLRGSRSCGPYAFCARAQPFAGRPRSPGRSWRRSRGRGS